jgi:hypothetical protein
MSFNQSHINITFSNYEEAFLLYIDGELNAEGMAAVESFAALHPHLQEELDILLTTKLDSEEVVLEGKEALLAEQMKADMTEESLLLYVDDELTGNEKAEVEKKLFADKEYNQLYQGLKSTKLPVDKSIVYPNKAELYRHTEKRIQPRLWLSIAAAVVILLGIGWLWTSIENQEPNVAPPLASGTELKPKVEKNIEPVKIKEDADVIPEHLALQETTSLKKEKSSTEIKLKKDAALLQQSIPAPDERDRALVLNETRTNVTMPTDGAEKALTQQQTINNQTVTTTVTPAYTTTEGDAKTETMVSHVAAISNDDKKGSVRGFLRKASRFIERRTGINPVNEDDELLIGVVALKLK